ncbi:type I 3-dehydroquinate dehydratase [bacterium]|nr:type I 3-dehydroquinate dehydratase [bacterium]
MICVSFLSNDLDMLIKQISSVELAEIRLDNSEFSCEQLDKLFSISTSLIVTCRSGKFSDSDRFDILKHAIHSGVDFIDVDIRNSVDFIDSILLEVKKKSCKLILSFHEYDKCPLRDELDLIVKKCFSLGGDIAKIACKVNSDAECARLLALYDSPRAGEIISIGMGRRGRVTRVASVCLGAPFTYASYSSGMETAVGQLNYKELEKILDDINCE